MRHRKINNKFHRKSGHRNSMFRNMIISLIKYEIIKTTLPKAKEIKRIIEPLITYSKIDSISRRRFIFSKIRNIEIVKKLFDVVGIRFKNRTGGYIRILKYKNKIGVFSMAYIELLDRIKK